MSEENVNVTLETPVGNQEAVEGSQQVKQVEQVDQEKQVEQPETTDSIPISVESHETVETVPSKQTKEENAFYKAMRQKAEKEAEAKISKQVEELKSKIKKCLPDGYTDVDEYLNSIIEESIEEESIDEQESVEQEPVEQEPIEASETIPLEDKEVLTTAPATIFDEKKIEELVAKKLENIPELQEIKKAKKKEEEDKFIISSFEELRLKFPQIKTPNDVPIGVWELWRVGKSGRSLVSCMKEHSYDYDIEKATQKGAAVVKAQINSVAHTGVINSGSNTNVTIEKEVSIPPETQKMLAKTGIPKDKWLEYYKKYHRQ